MQLLLLLLLRLKLLRLKLLQLLLLLLRPGLLLWLSKKLLLLLR